MKRLPDVAPALGVQTRLPRFMFYLLLSVGLAGLIGIVFVACIHAQQQVDRANQQRYQSYLLADELRQSGDDLTRMIRAYAVTGDPIYKQHFQHILDIRDGIKPRPEHAERPYWDLLLAPRPYGPAIPLLELMRQAGFTKEEFDKMALAKANSDALTLPEIAAMKLIESPGPQAQANRAKAISLLFDSNYMAAKSRVMKPIDDFMEMLDRRTLASVRAAETRVRILWWLFAGIALALSFTFWLSYVALSQTLGGSLGELSTKIAQLGSGDFSSAAPLDAGRDNSVLGWLESTRAELAELNRERESSAIALRESMHQLQLISDTTPALISYIGSDFRYRRVNRSYKVWFGKSLDEVRGHTVRDVLGESGWKAVRPYMEQAQAGQTVTFERQVPYVDGGTRWVHATYTPYRDPSGRIDGIVAHVIDISELKRAEAEVLKLNAGLELRVAQRTAELEAVNKELEAFAYSVSHDLRAPLRSIDGFSQVLLEDYAHRLDEDGRDSLRRVRQATQRMGHTIEDLLMLSRVTRAALAIEAVDLSGMAESVAAAMRQMAPDRQVEISIAPGMVARSDARLLHIAIENLFSNAWNFTGKKVSPRIEFAAQNRPGECVYHVRDNGAGFDMAYADNLFAPFQRLHTVAEFPGTGIGLAIVKRAIARLGGRVWAEGTTGQGATFFFTLPDAPA